MILCTVDVRCDTTGEIFEGFSQIKRAQAIALAVDACDAGCSTLDCTLLSAICIIDPSSN